MCREALKNERDEILKREEGSWPLRMVGRRIAGGNIAISNEVTRFYKELHNEEVKERPFLKG